MAFKSYREQSKTNWGRECDGTLTQEEIQHGAILRIADACEAMAFNHIRLTEDRNRYERYWREEQKITARLGRANAALRGHLRRVKALARATTP